jgi:hypothetical protein
MITFLPHPALHLCPTPQVFNDERITVRDLSQKYGT